MDCQWIDKNLEALFSGTLSHEDQQRAEQHIESCGACEKEVAALNAIDPLIKSYFQNELYRVRQGASRSVVKGRLAVATSVALIAVGVLIAATLRTSHSDLSTPSAPPVPAANSLQSQQTPPSVKSADAADAVERAKPLDSTPNAAAITASPAATRDNNAPDFMVIDPAGYSRTLADYRGYVFIVGVLGTDQSDTTSDFERLYKEFAANRKMRFLAVANDRQFRRANTTFPVAYNQGSKLFGTAPGDFILLDESGSIQLRGSLTKDFDKLEKALQNAG